MWQLRLLPLIAAGSGRPETHDFLIRSMPARQQHDTLIDENRS